MSVARATELHNQLIDNILNAIDLARETGDPVTLSLLKMALLREVEILDDLPDTDAGNN